MKAVKRKWAIHQTYQRIQKLWEEYKQVSNTADLELVAGKLSKFLDGLKTAFEQWNGADIPLDKNSDFGEIFVNLVQDSSAPNKDETTALLADLVNKSLSVVETILKDEKYRSIVSRTPSLINSVLELLEKMQTTEGKKMALRILTTLAESQGSKLAIGKSEGFKKILLLLLEGDTELTAEIIRTIKRLMPHEDLELRVPQSNTAERTTSNTTYFTALVGDKLASIFGEVREVVVKEVSKAFPKKVTPSNTMTLPQRNVAYSFIPTAQQLEQALESLERRSEDVKLDVPSKEIVNMTLKDSELLTEYMRVQGALSSLTEALKEAASLNHIGKLDFVETICRLIFNNRQSQLEFRRLDGYSIFKKIVCEVTDSGEHDEEQSVFLEDLFNIFFVVTVDGNQDSICENADAFELILDIATTAPSLNARVHALLCMQDILTANPLNVAVMRKIGSFEKILRVLCETSELKSSKHGCDYTEHALHLLIYCSVLLDKTSNEITYSLLESIGTCNAQIQRDLARSVLVILEDRLAKVTTVASQGLIHEVAPLDYANVVERLLGIIRGHSGSLKSDLLQSLAVILESIPDATYIEFFERFHIFDEIYQIVVLPERTVDPEQVDAADICLFIISRYHDRLFSTKAPLSSDKALHWLLKIFSHFSVLLGTNIKSLSQEYFLESPSSLTTADSGFFSPTTETPIFHTMIDKAQEAVSEFAVCCNSFVSVLSLLRQMLVKESNSLGIRVALREAQVIESLVELLSLKKGCVRSMKSLEEPIELVRFEATAALGALIKGSAEEKSFIADNIGFDAFLTALSPESNTYDISKQSWKVIAEVITVSAGSETIIDVLQAPLLISCFGDIPLSTQTPAIDAKHGNKPVQEELYLKREKFFECCLEPQVLYPRLPPFTPGRKLHFHKLSRNSSDESVRSSNVSVGAAPDQNNLGVAQSHSQQNSTEKISRHSRQSSAASTVSKRNNRSLNRPQPLIMTNEGSNAGSINQLFEGQAQSRRKSHASNLSVHSGGHQHPPKITTSPKSPQPSNVQSDSIQSERSVKTAKRQAFPPFAKSHSGGITSTQRSSEGSLVSVPVSYTSKPEDHQHQSKPNSELQAFDLRGITFQSKEAVAALLKLLRVLEPIKFQAHREFFALLFLLLKSSPVNKELFCESGAIRQFSETLLKFLKMKFDGDSSIDWHLLIPYKDILTTLIYHTCSSDVIGLLFMGAKNPLEIVYASSENGYALPNAVDLEQAQIQFLDIICHIADRQEPKYFLSFDGVKSQLSSLTFDRFPSVKYGFTLSCWIRINAFTGKEVGLLTIEDQLPLGPSSRVLQSNSFELYFKELASRSSHQKRSSSTYISYSRRKFCLAVKSQHFPMPPEDFVFDGFDFSYDSERPQWHHVCFVHGRQGMSLYVDGEFIQQSSSFNYPKVSQAKERPFNIVFGRKSRALQVLPSLSLAEGKPMQFPSEFSATEQQNGWFSYFVPSIFSSPTTGASTPTASTPEQNISISYSGFFCGFLASLNVYEGMWEAFLIEEVFNMGVSDSKNQRLLTTDMRPFYSIDPASLTANDSLTGERVIHSSSLSSINRKMSHMQLSSATDAQRRPEELTERSFHVHIGSSLSEVISEHGGLLSLLQFLDVGPSQQAASLRAVGNLLFRKPWLSKQFSMINGWNCLYQLLSQNPDDLTIDIFETLLDIATDHRKRKDVLQIVNVDCIRLLLDLLVYSRDNVQLQMFRQLVEMVLGSEANLKIWKNDFGLPFCFEILVSANQGLKSLVLRLVDAQLNKATEQDITNVLEFISYDRKRNLNVKFDLTEILYRRVCKGQDVILDHLKALNATNVLIGLLETNHEQFRLVVLKLIGIMITHPNPKISRAVLNKVAGFQGIALFLTPHKVTFELCDVLIGVSLGWYALGKSESQQQDSLQDGKSLIHPEIIKVILDLLRSSSPASQSHDDMETVFYALAEMKRLLTLDNMKILWEYPWIEWLQQFQASFSQASVDEQQRIEQLLMPLCQKMMIYDVQRKNSYLVKVKGELTESDAFQALLVESVLNHYDANPCLPSDSAPEITKHLVLLHKYMDENNPSLSIYRKLLNTIHQLVCHNTSTTRTLMRSNGLLDARDEIVLRLLQIDVPTDSFKTFISTFSFDQVADQAKFRDSSGLLFMLRKFHQLSQSVETQAILGTILVDLFLPYEENRKQIQKLFEDMEVFQMFMSASKSSPDAVQTSKSISIQDFISWYYSNSPDILLRRQAIEQRLELLFLPISQLQEKAQEKILKRNKRYTAAKDRQLRQNERINKQLSALRDKITERLHRLAGNHQESQDIVRKARYDRRRLGEEAWKEWLKNK